MTPQSPERQTRRQIERELAEQRRNWRNRGADRQRIIAKLERQLADLRKVVAPEQFAKLEAKFQRMFEQMRRKRRRPGEGGMPALVEPPRGPLPLSGGAEVPLEFDD